MPGFLGPWELAILAVIVALLFGGKRLPELGRSLGRSLREIRQAAAVRDALELREETKKAVAELKPGKPTSATGDSQSASR